MRLQDIASLFALSLIWGSAFMLVKVALDDLEPLTLVAGRLFGAAVFLVLVLLVTRRSLPRPGRVWYPFIVLGLLNNVYPFTLLTWGQQHIDSSLAAILVSSMALWTAVLAHFWIDERLTLDRSLGLIIGFAGVIVLIGADLRDITDSSTLGQLAIVAGVLGYAFGTVYVRGFLTERDAVVTATGQTIVAATVMAPLALAVDAPFDIDLSTKTALAWLTLGVVSSGIAYLIYFRLIRNVTATQAALVGYLIPVTAVFLGAFVLDERLGVNSFAGLALIILGVWVVSGGSGWLLERIRRDQRALEVEAKAGSGDGG